MKMQDVVLHALEEAAAEHPTERAHLLLQRLRERRYPVLSTKKAAFIEAAGRLQAVAGLAVGDPKAFEDNCVTLSLRFETPGTLRKQVRALESALESGDVARLLAIVQGEE